MKKIVLIISFLIIPFLSCFNGYNDIGHGSLKMMLYVINGSASTVSGYSINPRTGSLSIVNTVNTGASPNCIKSDPSGRFVYVSNSGSASVSGYAINPEDGSLTSLQSSPFTSGDLSHNPISLSIHPNGKYIYVTNCDLNVVGFEIISSTGSLTSIGTFAAPNYPNFNSIDPGGNYFYNGEDTGVGVRWYPINSETGLLTYNGPNFTGGGYASISSITVEPLGRFLYTNGSGSIWVSIINSSTGALSIPINQTLSGNSIAFNSKGNWAFVQNVVSNKISVYNINSSTGALTQITGSPYSAGTGLSSAIVDPSGKFLYASNATDNTISFYNLDSSSGALTFVENVTTAAGPSFMNVVVLP